MVKESLSRSTFSRMKGSKIFPNKLCEVSRANVEVCIFRVNVWKPIKVSYLFKVETNQQN